jgi:hypothetical protein
MPAANSSFPTEVAAAAWEDYRESFVIQFIRKNLFLWLAKRYDMYKVKAGSPSIVQPIILSQSTGFKSYDQFDFLDDTPQYTLDAGNFDWKFFSISVLLDGPSAFKSGGPTQAVDLWDAKVAQAENTADIKMGTQWFGDGTGNGGKDLVGLRSIVDSDGTFGTYAGINSLTSTNWQNQYEGSVGSFATNGVDKMRSMYNLCCQGMSDAPKLIIWTRAIDEAYEKTLVNNLYVTLKDLDGGDTGFTAKLWKNVPIVWHDACQTGLAYFLNPKYLGFVVGKGREFTSTEKPPEKQDARKMYLLAACNAICTNRSAQGVLAGITTP